MRDQVAKPCQKLQFTNLSETRMCDSRQGDRSVYHCEEAGIERSSRGFDVMQLIWVKAGEKVRLKPGLACLTERSIPTLPIRDDEDLWLRSIRTMTLYLLMLS